MKMAKFIIAQFKKNNAARMVAEGLHFVMQKTVVKFQ